MEEVGPSRRSLQISRACAEAAELRILRAFQGVRLISRRLVLGALMDIPRTTVTAPLLPIPPQSSFEDASRVHDRAVALQSFMRRTAAAKAASGSADRVALRVGSLAVAHDCEALPEDC